MKFYIISDYFHIYTKDEKGDVKKIEELNKSEFLILLHLYKHNSKIVSRSELIEAGWPGRVVSENSLNVAMMKLRRKLSSLTGFAKVETFLGQGYRLIMEDQFSIEVIGDLSFLECKDKDINSSSLTVESKHKIETGKISFFELVKNKFYFYKSYFDSCLSFQFLVFILVSMLVFVYFYSESWASFYCTEETVCSDYLK